MSWNNWFAKTDQTKERIKYSHVLYNITNHDVMQILRGRKVRTHVSFFPFFATHFRNITPNMDSYWPTASYLIKEELESFDKEDLTKIQKVEKRTFLDRFKNSLDIAVISQRVKCIGYDPMYSITDKEYCSALNKFIEYKWDKNFYRIYRLNIGLMAVAATMGMISDQSGFYWGVFVTGAVNLLRTFNNYPPRMD